LDAFSHQTGKETHMKPSIHFGMLAFLVFGGIIALAPARAQQPNSTAPTVSVRTLITVTTKKGMEPVQLTPRDLLVQQSKVRLRVTSVTPATGENGGMQLAIVIDDSATSSLNNQLPDIAKFIREQEPNVKVGVFYARNGTVQVRQDFTPDHELAAKSLRIPLGQGGAYTSAYLSVMDLMKRWPATQDRRELLLFTDGVDRFRHGPLSPDVESTYEMAQKQGIVLHSIVISVAGGRRGGMRMSNGQNNLSQITAQSGGFLYNQGFQTPVDMTPFLDQLDGVLRSQYWVTYLAHPKDKPSMQEIKFSTELPGVKIYAPAEVPIPAANQ
jgi:hypothetical protein